MEIQKIFSNIENPSEKFYSVLVSEEELALLKEFSDKMSDEEYESKVKKISKDAVKAGAGIGAGLVGAGAAAGYAASLAGLAYAGKKLHDISKQEKDPRFAKKFEEVTAKGKK